MSTGPGELTSAASWDELWSAQSAPTGGLSRHRWLKKSRLFDALITELLDDGSRPGDDVLEIGCAPGQMIVDMHRQRPDRRYRGIDFAAQGLEFARKRLAAYDIDAALEFGDMKTAQIAPAELVVSFGLIEHFDDPSEAPSHHARFASPRGHVAVTVPNYAHPTVVRILSRFSPETLATHNLEIMNPDAMRRAMEGAGLTGVRTGYAGVAAIPTSRVRRDRVGKVFGVGARAWSVATSAVPAGWPWANHVWGFGTKSDDA